MKRREALKNIGLGLGYTATLPSAFSILQSCKTETKKWQPIFFTTNEGIVIQNIVDLILPTTKSSPGALDVNVPEFIDLYAHKVYNEEDAKKYRKGIQNIVQELLLSKTDARDIKREDYELFLNKYLRADKETQKQYKHNKDQTYKALINLREQSIWAYKTSEEIGENVLAYDPIPSTQKGCISLDEATGGKAWSL
ncbi:gluconate 2-dehydrogenase subunit 3 family protein [Tamlana sp. 2201CG12-4]|uniref:gluconate 2-dehydrogenase subunit 3 family protein n=1 Tax=Tamlana sp. 2201CG12-4 TaxID=3112582 RepID=UPI002DBA2D94|nr:gluconate 2-dehydrogenase subunit 3 family protein [Tamlana sp. 2201CG12-4]MEC3905663.1 gluconate 2-dehydrogenase subunit 3 family protein [Tamlana sp. 2201CG12-4]